MECLSSTSVLPLCEIMSLDIFPDILGRIYIYIYIYIDAVSPPAFTHMVKCYVNCSVPCLFF